DWSSDVCSSDLPEAGGRRMGSVLVDGRVVVIAEDRAARREDLPGRNVGAVGSGEVIPVEDDWRLSLLDGGRSRLHRREIALDLELVEEVDALADVIG